MRKVPYSFKNEELIPFCDFVFSSYTANQPAFIDYSPNYGGDHLSGCINTRDTVDRAINPKTLTAKLKGVTRALYAHLDNGLNIIDDVERYCEKGKVPLTKKDLEITRTRRKCHSRDAEGAIRGFKLMRELIGPHLAVLEEQGYTKSKQERLIKLIKDINDNNVLQNSIINERAVLVQNNIGRVCELWEKITDILKTGKIIYKTDPAKRITYTQTRILERIRQNRDKDSGVKGKG